MVRTKGDGAVTKVVGAKAPRKQLVSNTGASSSAYSSQNDSAKKNKPASGLPYCPQPTPEWQKSVKSFFTFSNREDKENEVQNAGSDDAVEESKGKQPEKRSRKGKGGKKSGKVKSSKSKSEEDNSIEEVNKETTEVQMEVADKDEEDSKADNNSADGDIDNTNNDEDEEPVKRKRNNIIESDEDE